MVILFSPSEGKRKGGDGPSLVPSSFLFPERFTQRMAVLEQYQTIIQKGNITELSDLFGIKDEKEFQRYTHSLDTAATMKAIERYDGVAYDYLQYHQLEKQAQEYIDRNVIIFSNLFGPIRAADMIPDYKLKQGSSIGTFAPEKFYKKHFSDVLDQMIGKQDVLDLRAGFYDKFYTCVHPPTTLKFLKEGKVVSHWAKAYRGIVLREAAKYQIDSLADFLALRIEGLELLEVNETAKKREVIYTIG
ncbi:MAG TPA: YaaA family protein [Sulfuricurvum sp.]|nr:YaaA family protein [Sulfuricurvum sp.]